MDAFDRSQLFGNPCLPEEFDLSLLQGRPYGRGVLGVVGDVEAFAAIETVGVATADEKIVPVTSEQPVGTTAAMEHVVSVAARKTVCGIVSDQRVAAVAGFDVLDPDGRDSDAVLGVF